MPAQDASPVILEHVKLHTVGFGLAHTTPATHGSGVLIRFGKLAGILTCAHVEDRLRKLGRVGLVDLTRGDSFQSTMLDMNVTQSIYRGDDPWPGDKPDIAFLPLEPPQVQSVEARGLVFLNAERNFERFREPEPSTQFGDAAFGMIEKFTAPTPQRNNGVATRGMTAVLTPGHIVERNDKIIVLECRRENVPDLPSSFEGTSGGGLWRAYLRYSDDGVPEFVQLRLLGVASRQVLDVTPPRIVCQSLQVVAMILADARAALSA